MLLGETHMLYAIVTPGAHSDKMKTFWQHFKHDQSPLVACYVPSKLL